MSFTRRNRKEDEEVDDDNPWGDLDKAFENLQDKSLYKQVYAQQPSSSSPPSSPPTSPAAKDPIAEMEEAIFARAGAAAVKSASSPTAPKLTMGPTSGVRFSDTPPSPSSAAGAKWSEYMQESSAGDEDSPWSSLDAFADNPDSSAEFAVPLHLEDQHRIMSLSAAPTSPPPGLGTNDDFLRQQMQLQSEERTEEEAMFAHAGAAAVARMFSTPPSEGGNEDFIRQQSPPLEASSLSHINPTTGGANMVDVSPKATTFRSATAVGRVFLPRNAADLVRATENSHGVSGKGPVLHTAQLAGIMAAKRTAELIPLCHPLPLTHVELNLSIVDGESGEESWIGVECTARTKGETGVEMEALTGVSVACLTIWDMVKAVAGKSMRIGEIVVVKKSGGKNGDWERTP